eukprot:CAMPEP_0178968634 /NCGR_PEP_ID=MMETSP0789-20121207/18378_1 /TAXON_ID=3005 /ORGANISM="Rhizosolenia setigera, Strain CCMP 1694" /LENGTH=1391 /DNA_ID=CAMNT_0020654615 /DNA_START=25 /DNA_END=4196 /DNA_ORIENTATION=-
MVDTENNSGSKDKDKESSATPTPQASVRDVFSFGFGLKQKSLFLIGCISSTLSGCVFPSLAFFFAKVFEELSVDPSDESFLDGIQNMAFTFGILGILICVLMTIQALCFEMVATEMTHSLRVQWFNALLRQDQAYHDLNIQGVAMSLNENALKYKKGLGRKFGEGVQFSITAVGGLVYAFYVSWKTSLIVLASLPFMSLSALFLTRATQSQTSNALKGYSQAGEIVYTATSNIRTISSLNAGNYILNKFQQATQKAFDFTTSKIIIVGLANGVVMAMFLFSYILLTLYGCYLLYSAVKKEGCDPSGAVPDNFTCTESAADVFGALMGVSFSGSVLPQATLAIEAFSACRVACYPAIVAIRRKLDSSEKKESKSAKTKRADDIESSTDPSTTTDTAAAPTLPKYEIDPFALDVGEKPSSIDGDIEFHNVKFQYPSRPGKFILNGLNLKIKAGSTVALVGPSGEGKSTIVRLIERFYDVNNANDGGYVSLDGKNLKDLNVNWLRNQIGLVSQEPVLFSCSIRDNIAHGVSSSEGGSGKPTQEQIEEAAKMANAHDFIMSFPDGYDTQVGDKGSKLSGGQKQRIAIARVLIRNPSILLLDEATSALDNQSERLVQNALENLLQSRSRTTIIIAHRLSTVRKADQICVISQGKCSEIGSHDALMENTDGIYRKLVIAQNSEMQTKNDDDETTPADNNVDVENNKDEKQLKANKQSLLSSSNTFAPTGNELISFKDVTFAYPTRPSNNVLNSLNLSIYEGETLALVGKSGGGKSTIIQLLERFYDVNSGEICLNGLQYRDINVKSLRSQFGLVEQEPVLFNESIAENISYGLENVTQEQIEQAAKTANAHDFIMRFPKGYKTKVSQKLVSGGEKQRLALARAILRSPKILLLDEATSALDAESEQAIKVALDNIRAMKSFTVVIIAHRLSTIIDANRIAVIGDGSVLEIGPHTELMQIENGHYKRLHNAAQHESQQQNQMSTSSQQVSYDKTDNDDGTKDSKNDNDNEESEVEITEEDEKAFSNRAKLMSRADLFYLFIGSIGAILTGVVFPGWGIIFAFMIEALYMPVFKCEGELEPPLIFQSQYVSCTEYLDDVADEMKQMSIHVTYGYLGLMASTILGNALVSYGFGRASEAMNKRVRDSAFQSLIRQEIAFFDLRSVGSITTHIQEDAAMIHAFCGEPIRALVLNLSSLLVGLVLSFVYMWPFALGVLVIIPFMAFGAMVEMKLYMGEDDTDVKGKKEDKSLSGSILLETLLNITTVASLGMEKNRLLQYEEALQGETNPSSKKSCCVSKEELLKAMTTGLGQLCQYIGMGLMFWWGGWLLYKMDFTFRDFNIAMFGLLFSLSGTATAAQGATDKEKAKKASKRIFSLIDKQSKIDPLDDEKGKILENVEPS